MENFPCCKLIKKDTKKGSVLIEIPNNVMENPSSVYLLDKRNGLVIKEITDDFKMPISTTRIKLQIIPSNMTQYYYTLNGLETILFNLFRSDNKSFQEDLKRGEVYLKTYYEKDEFYTIPILCLEVIFLRKLHPKTIDNLWKTLKTDLLFFTGNVGDIELRDFHSALDFNDYLKIPLLVGEPEFKNEGILQRKHFYEEQITEMNYIHGISLIKLNMNEVVNNKYLSLFDYIRSSIAPSHHEESYSIDKTLLTRDDIENLPF